MKIDKITEIIQHIRNGQIVALPTDTVYGLMADATNPEAVAALFHLKARESYKPLQILVSSLEQAQQCGVFSAEAMYLAKCYWAGALTIVVPRREGRYPLACNIAEGKKTLGIRWAKHPLIQAVLEGLDYPLVATSANVSGYPPLQDIKAIKAFFPHIYSIEDTMACGAAASTVVDCTTSPYTILRQGDVILPPIITDLRK